MVTWRWRFDFLLRGEPFEPAAEQERYGQSEARAECVDLMACVLISCFGGGASVAVGQGGYGQPGAGEPEHADLWRCVFDFLLRGGWPSESTAGQEGM